jgi:hypothetical protein
VAQGKKLLENQRKKSRSGPAAMDSPPHRHRAYWNSHPTRPCENGFIKKFSAGGTAYPRETHVTEPTLDDRFDELRHTVDREIARARSDVIAEFARAVSRMRTAVTEAEWQEAVLDSGRIFANDPVGLELMASLAALTAPGNANVALECTGPEPPASEVAASQLADSNGPQAASPGPGPTVVPDYGGDPVGNAAALRFARVKVAEIQLYQADAVKAGRTSRDLYGALKGQIDHDREAFRELFLSNGSKTTDYLHAEMLHALAHDDATLLGPNYPGPLA